MKRCPVTLLVFALAYGPSTVLYSSGAWAIPDNQSASVVSSISAYDIHSENPALGHVQERGSGVLPEAQVDVSFSNDTCRQDITGAGYTDDIPEGMPCVDAADTKQRFSVQFGRRVGTRGDILGEFDGVRVDYRLGDGLNLNGIAGYSVLAEEDVFNPTRQVYGICAETDQLARTWDLSSYLFEQQENGQVAGRSMGGAIRHLQPGRSLLFYLDYDVAHNALGTLMASGAWKLPFKTTASATFDRHGRPIPARQQLYLQKSMTVTDGWNWTLPAERLAYHTADGSGEVSILAVGLSHALSRRIKLSGDVVRLDVTTTPTSEYFYHLKLSGKDLLMPGVRSKLDLRHSVTETGRTNTATIDTKYTFRQFWNLVSQLRADYFSPALESRSHWVASPKLKMEYRRNNQYGFHIAAGGKLSTDKNTAADDARSSYFVSLGYQLTF